MKYILIFINIFLTRDNLTAQMITTFAGTGIAGYAGDGGPATLSKIYDPTKCVFDRNGNCYVNVYNDVIRMIDTTGLIHTVVGTGIAGFSGDGGLATLAKINFPSYVARDNYNNIYISDAGNYRIRKINLTTNVITTIAGNGSVGSGGDGGPATNASLSALQGMTFDVYNNLYFCNGSSKIRKIDASGIISTFAGNGMIGFSGDGGPATNAKLWAPTGITCDSHFLYIADWNNLRVRKVNFVTGIIETIAGNGMGTYSGDGVAATSTALSPRDIVKDWMGRLVIADYGNQRIRMIDTSGIIYTIAGTGVIGYSGDGGIATSAKLNNPSGVSYDFCGNLYIADNHNSRLRKISYPSILTTPTISLTGITTAPVSSTVTVNATVASAGSSYVIRWMNHGVEFTTTTIPVVTYTKMPGIDTITARIVPTGYGCWDSTTSAGHIVASEMPSSIFVYGVSGGVYVYPNPANDELHINTSPGLSKGEVVLCNMVGQVVLSQQLNSKQTTLNIKHLPPGLYLLALTDEEGRRTVHKIVKE